MRRFELTAYVIKQRNLKSYVYPFKGLPTPTYYIFESAGITPFITPEQYVSEGCSVVEGVPVWFSVASWTQGAPSSLKFTVVDPSQLFYNKITPGSTRLRIVGIIDAISGDIVSNRLHSSGITTITMTTTSINLPGSSGQNILKVN